MLLAPLAVSVAPVIYDLVMTESDGWEPLRDVRRSSTDAPRPEQPPQGIGNGLIVTPFTRLARVHALSVIGDGCIAVALAGSIFFSIDPADARWRVAFTWSSPSHHSLLSRRCSAQPSTVPAADVAA